jgi:hypothetical protein
MTTKQCYIDRENMNTGGVLCAQSRYNSPNREGPTGHKSKKSLFAISYLEYNEAVSAWDQLLEMESEPMNCGWEPAGEDIHV